MTSWNLRLSVEIRNSLKTEFYQNLAKVNYDLPKLFDLIPNTCDDYFSEIFEGEVVQLKFNLPYSLIIC